MKRRNPLQPMLTIEAYDSMFEEIEKQYPEGENVDEKRTAYIRQHLTFLFLSLLNSRMAKYSYIPI